VKGTIIHEVLRGRDASTVLKEYGLYSEEHVRQCEEILSKFLASDLMKRMKRSYCELPFVVTLASGAQVTGKIDRLCEMVGGSWIVIDYKSEASADYAVVAEEYILSLSVYGEAARQIVRKDVEAWVFFTEMGQFYKN
jgi:ATP-dependent exoDNAse (exonuclease V) beta subunit